MDTNLSNKVAVITGGSSGIGKSIALAMAAEGADIAVNYLSNDQGALETAEKIKGMGRKCLVVKGDICQKSEVDKLTAQVLQTFGGIDILVNNAGSIFRRSAFLDLDEELWDRSMALNLKAAYLCSRAFMPSLIERGGGCVINMSSVAARLGSPGETVHYAVAKAGVNTLTLGLAKEFGGKGIRVNAIAPGTVDTPLLEKASTSQEWKEGRIKKTLLGRMGTTEEIAAMAVFLASDSGSFITGQVIDISGGRF